MRFERIITKQHYSQKNILITLTNILIIMLLSDVRITSKSLNNIVSASIYMTLNREFANLLRSSKESFSLSIWLLRIILYYQNTEMF